MENNHVTNLSNSCDNKAEAFSSDLNKQQIDKILKNVSEDSSSTESEVSQSLSRFLDESNVSMMGGWT